MNHCVWSNGNVELHYGYQFGRSTNHETTCSDTTSTGSAAPSLSNSPISNTGLRGQYIRKAWKKKKATYLVQADAAVRSTPRRQRRRGGGRTTRAGNGDEGVSSGIRDCMEDKWGMWDEEAHRRGKVRHGGEPGGGGARHGMEAACVPVGTLLCTGSRHKHSDRVGLLWLKPLEKMGRF